MHVEPPLTIGISQCLLGDPVRYDGVGAASSFPADKLHGLFEYVGLCPEMAIGLGVPRKPIRLVGTASENRVVGVVDPSLDVTDALNEFGEQSIAQIANFDGYVFMHNSPSCGLHRTKVYPPGGNAPAARVGRGAFACTVTEKLPNLPVEEG